MHSEDDLLFISALQHLVYCERQWGLIHLEGLWEENLLTTEGRILHQRTHEASSEMRGGLWIARSVRLRSLRLGLSGQADLVEFHPLPEDESNGAGLPNLDGLWRPFPVEYKRGRPKPGPEDEIQLCAQALCLEEMLGAAVPAGAIYYGQPKRRHQVAFSPELRLETEQAAARLHQLTGLRRTPPAEFGPRCRRCSLSAVCLPQTTGGRSARRYTERMLQALIRPEGQDDHETSA